MRVFGIDPGSIRTGYGCVDGGVNPYRLVACGAISTASQASFPEKLRAIHDGLAAVLGRCRPQYVVVESLFHAHNVRSALKLGHARGVAVLAATQAGVPVCEYSATQVKRAVVGYGRADKQQVQHMVKLLLGLEAVPAPHDAADALAIAICHLHMGERTGALELGARRVATSWRDVRLGARALKGTS